LQLCRTGAPSANAQPQQSKADAESHLLQAAMNSLEKRLDPGDFLRTHLSTTVNARRIRELHPLFHGEFQTVRKNGALLTSGCCYREKLSGLPDNHI
jgi:two-component system LytT family response regulator